MVGGRRKDFEMGKTGNAESESSEVRATDRQTKAGDLMVGADREKRLDIVCCLAKACARTKCWEGLQRAHSSRERDKGGKASGRTTV